MLLRRTLALAPAGILGPAIQLAALLVWTHWLSPAELGALALAVALQDLAHLAATTWWSNYVLRYLAPPGNPLRARQDRAEPLVLLLACAAQAVLAPAAVALLVGGPLSPALTAAAAAAAVARSLAAHWSVRARAEGRAGPYAALQALAPALALALGLAALPVLGASAATVLATTAAAYGLVAALAAPWLGLGVARPVLDRSILRKALRYGLLASIGSGFAWLSINGIRFTTEALVGTAAVGLLSAGWTLGQRLASQIAALATSAALPLAVARSREAGLGAGLDQLGAAAAMLLALAVPAAAGLALIAAPVAELLTAPAYREATAAVLPWAMLAGTLSAFRYHVVDEVLQLAERPDLMLRFDALEAAVTVALCAAGTWRFGLLGGAVGCTVAAALVTAAALALAAARFGFRIPAAGLVPVAVATLAMVAVTRALPAPGSLVELALVVAAAVATYAALYGALAFRHALVLRRAHREA